MKIFSRLIFSILALSLSVTMGSSKVVATHSTFNPGAIIDDARFTNYQSMSEGDIQHWLSNTANSTCLKDYYSQEPIYDTSQSRNVRYGDQVRASKIIWKTAQQFGINPQVLVVTLQKEQGLVTRGDCPDWRYRSAMGMGCPDGANCDAEYFGFSRQLWEGAKLLRNCFHQDVGWYCSYVPYTSGYVKYNPSSSCGGTNVYISNRATATLYTYTPYQPNAGALSSMGEAPCGAYGNRNFLHYLDLWFPPTPYASGYSGQSLYPTLAPGTSSTIFMSYKNYGYAAWYDDASASGGNKPVHLSTSHPLNRSSAFGSSWGGDRNRATGLFKAVYESDGVTLAGNQHVAQPGQIAKFEFTITIPANYAAGTYREFFQPIVEGGSTMNDPWTFMDIIVTGVYSSEYVSQSTYPTIKPSESALTFLRYKNTGNTPWYDDGLVGAPAGTKPVRLATSHNINRTSPFGSTWGGDQNRAATTFATVYNADGIVQSNNQKVVHPGQIVKFEFKLSVPANYAAGTYREFFQPIVEGGTTMNDPWTFLDLTVPSASVASSNSGPLSLNLVAGQSHQKTLSYTNTGNTTWNSSTKLMATGSNAASFKHSSWASNSVAANLNEASVAPGGTGTFTVTLQAPSQGGNYSLMLTPGDGVSPYGQAGTTLNINVAPPFYGSAYKTQSTYPSLTPTSPSTSVYLEYTNSGNQTWYDDTGLASAPAGSKPVHLATSHPLNRNSLLGTPWGGDRNRATGNFAVVYRSDGSAYATNPHKVDPGESARFTFTFSAPPSTPPGNYREFFQPIVEGGTAMNDPWTFLDVTVTPSTFGSQYAGQSAYPIISRGGQAVVFINYKNTGNTPWYDDTSIGSAIAGTKPVRLATSHPINRTSAFGLAWGGDRNRAATNFKAVYEADGTTLAANQHVTQPGQIAKFEFTFTAPGNHPVGFYDEFFQPIVEGGTTMNDPWTFLRLKVE